MTDVAGDIRYAFRQATNRKLFSAIVVSLVAFGIGANASCSASFLYELSPSDPWSYILAIGLILSAALLAASLPVSQAIKLDPASVLRSE